LEIDKREADERGVVIVGLNPGRASEKERRYYIENGPSYETFVKILEDLPGSGNHPYNRRLRENVIGWGLTGPILWSELAKCQSKPDVTRLPLQTFRTCVGKFLNREMELVPHDWPIIAAGREAFKAISYLFSQRAVIGIPHPTGARTTKAQKTMITSKQAKCVIDQLLICSTPTAVWLPDKLPDF
jgi:hypothetical protein